MAMHGISRPVVDRGMPPAKRASGSARRRGRHAGGIGPTRFVVRTVSVVSGRTLCSRRCMPTDYANLYRIGRCGVHRDRMRRIAGPIPVRGGGDLHNLLCTGNTSRASHSHFAVRATRTPKTTLRLTNATLAKINGKVWPAGCIVNKRSPFVFLSTKDRHEPIHSRQSQTTI